MSLATPPGVYRHFKGSFYRVLFVATSATNGDEDGRPVVIYMSMNDGTIYARDEEEFHSPVLWTNPRAEPRFKLLVENTQ